MSHKSYQISGESPFIRNTFPWPRDTYQKGEFILVTVGSSYCDMELDPNGISCIILHITNALSSSHIMLKKSQIGRL